MRDTFTNTKFGSTGIRLLVVAAFLAAGFALVASPAAAAGNVTVDVNDTDATGIEGADVVLFDEADDTEAANGTTDSGGSVSFSSVADGTYYAEVTDPGYVDLPESANVSISASDGTISVEMYAATEQANKTLAVDENDTLSAYADVTTNGSLSTDGNATRAGFEVVGLNHTDGNTSETVLYNETTAVSENSTGSLSYSLTDSERETYDEIRIVVTGESAHVDAVEAGKTESVTGGGGSSTSGLSGLLTKSIYGIPAFVILIVLIGGAYWYREEEM